jgi:hypothetical protein
MLRHRNGVADRDILLRSECALKSPPIGARARTDAFFHIIVASCDESGASPNGGDGDASALRGVWIFGVVGFQRAQCPGRVAIL